MPVTVLLLGALLVLSILVDAFEVVLLPRPVRRQVRVNRYFFRMTWAVWSRLAKLWPAGRRREDFIGVYGPLAMVTLFALWGACLIVGFGLMQWALQRLVPDAGSDSLAAQMLVSGDAFFTLGYGDNVPHNLLARLLVIVEAGTGFGFIALTIGYLPVLYQHFARRDIQLIEFSARAGSPPTAASLLAWHAHGNAESLERWLTGWETWASDLIESHAVYPMLAFYRSQHEGHSWLGSLAVVLDVCTLLIAGGADARCHQATATFSALRRMLDESSEALATGRPKPASDRRMDDASLQTLTPTIRKLLPEWRDDAAARQAIRKLRSTYEPQLQGLAAYLMLPLPDWMGPDELQPERFGRDAILLELMKGRE
ncbi:potassium channel family protein [Variovorax sp. RHLX14]|uniref:potassium channel family protein n=1 Tax=Variovorax sp. RHLX14 TaxID=1259731 RepID=UPI003F47AF41